MPAFPWTNDPATSTTHVRAVHVNELRSAIDTLNSAVGIAPVSWQDGSSVSTDTHIRAGHFTQLQNAIQALWTYYGQGSLPQWTAGSDPSTSRQILASDINDLRSWVTTVDPPAAKRGFHCGPYNDSPSLQATYLSQSSGQFQPGMLVVLDNWFMSDYTPGDSNYGQVSDQAYANWLTSQQSAGVEVFVRTYRSGTYYSDGSSDPKYVTDADVFARMQAIYRSVHITRFIPGNEPNNEWNTAGQPSTVQFWEAVAGFYQSVLQDYVTGVDRDPNGNALLEVYFRGMGQGNYAESPDVDGSRDGYQVMQDYNAVLSNYGKFTWHAYYAPNNVQGTALAVESAFPDFLRNGIQQTGVRWPARVTESGYTPWIGSPTSPQPNRDEMNNGSYFWDDHVAFVRATMAGGVAVWLFDYYPNSDTPGADCISCAVAATNDGQSLRQWPQALAQALTAAGYTGLPS